MVFTKRVPATQEEEIRIIDDGKKVDLSKVPFKVNDWDNYAVEEAVQDRGEDGRRRHAPSPWATPNRTRS